MTDKIILASSNAGKVREINNLLSDHGIEVVPQTEYGVSDAIEDGLSFVENAIKKARHAAKHTGLPAIADDSGIEVDALNHAPGIYSARYSGEGDEKNNEKMLKELEGVETDKRNARYQCVMVFMRDAEDPTPIIAQGAFEGRILTEPKGDGGFGYDPIFSPDGYDKTFAEMSPEEKNALSHRGKAITQLAAFLLDN